MSVVVYSAEARLDRWTDGKMQQRDRSNGADGERASEQADPAASKQ